MSVEDEKYVMEEGLRYKLMTLNDFQVFRKLALSHDSGWTTHYSDKELTVQSKPPEDKSTSLNIIRARRVMPHVPPLVLYDQLQDAQYRATWDKNMMEGYNIVQLDAHNDIGYYAAKFPWPLANRDFCNMRAWMEFTNGEYIIMNHSVPHKRCPEKKGFVRAKSILTGFYMQPYNNGKGTMLIYVTHSDPCGSIPHAIINFAMTKGAPMILNNCEKCSEEYPAFVEKTYPPNYSFPWRTDKVDWGEMSELTSVQSSNNKRSDADHNDKVSTLSNTSITRSKKMKVKTKTSSTPLTTQLTHTLLTTNEESKKKTNVENNAAANPTSSSLTVAAPAKQTNTPKQTSLPRMNSVSSSSTSSYSKARLEEDGELPLSTTTPAASNQNHLNKSINSTNTNLVVGKKSSNVLDNKSKNIIIRNNSHGDTVNGIVNDATLFVDPKSSNLNNMKNVNVSKITSSNQVNGVSNGGSKELDSVAALREANSVRQFKVLVEDSMLAVDRSFAHEGRVPSSDEYKVRLKYTLEGIRQTIPK